MKGTFIAVSGSVLQHSPSSTDMKTVHDEPEPDRQSFLKDITDWILARSVDPVHAAPGKPKL
jgi:hypothetical protein